MGPLTVWSPTHRCRLPGRFGRAPPRSRVGRFSMRHGLAGFFAFCYHRSRFFGRPPSIALQPSCGAGGQPARKKPAPGGAGDARGRGGQGDSGGRRRRRRGGRGANVERSQGAPQRRTTTKPHDDHRRPARARAAQGGKRRSHDGARPFPSRNSRCVGDVRGRERGRLGAPSSTAAGTTRLFFFSSTGRGSGGRIRLARSVERRTAAALAEPGAPAKGR